MSYLNLNRTGLLIKKQWWENRRAYLMSTLALFSVLTIVFIMWLIMSGRWYDEKAIFVTGLVGLYITGCLFASNSLKIVNTKPDNLYWLTFPARHTEKLLVVLFYNVIVFTLVYILIFFLLKGAADSFIAYRIGDAENPSYTYRKVNWSRDTSFRQAIVYFSFGYFILQAAFILGSVAFKKYSFVITIIVSLSMVFLLGLTIAQISIHGFPKGYYYELFTLQFYSDAAGGIKSYQMSNWLRSGIEFFLKFMIAPFLWIITLFRLKEKEV